MTAALAARGDPGSSPYVGALFFPFALAKEGSGAGGGVGGFGRAYSSVHCRAVESCCLRLRTNWVAIEGTGEGRWMT